MNQQPNNFNYNQYYGYNPYSQQQYNEYMREQMRINSLRRKERNELIFDGIIIGATILTYLAVQIILASFLQHTPYYHLYNDSPIFQYAFNVIVVHVLSLAIPFSIMALILRKRFTGPLVPTKKIGAPSICAWISLGMGLTMLASFFTNLVIMVVDKFGYELSQPDMLVPDSVFALVVSTIAISIIPGIIEEYAMRCCALGALKKYGKGFAVVTVSVVFGLIHGNVIQFIFAFLVGVILGYITVRTDTVVPAMFIHAFNNGLSSINDIVKYFTSEHSAKIVVGALTYMWIALAVAGLIYLITNKELLPRKEMKTQKQPYELSFGAKLLCLIPGFFIPFMTLIGMTSLYIKHK